MIQSLRPPQTLGIRRVKDPFGDLSFIEAHRVVPFDIRRVYFIIGILAHAKRGGHADKDSIEVIIAASGAFTAQLEGQAGNRSGFRLDSPDRGLMIDSLYWRVLTDCDEGPVCLVLASGYYDEDKYLRDYEELLNHRPVV